MELMAVIKGLEQLKWDHCTVKIFSDSKYVVEAIRQEWLLKWEKKGWKKVKNPDLWKLLLPLYLKHSISFEWVKGHSGHPENERCDQLAVEALRGPGLQIDAGFEQMQKDKQHLI